MSRARSGPKVTTPQSPKTTLGMPASSSRKMPRGSLQPSGESLDQEDGARDGDRHGEDQGDERGDERAPEQGEDPELRAVLRLVPVAHHRARGVRTAGGEDLGGEEAGPVEDDRRVRLLDQLEGEEGQDQAGNEAGDGQADRAPVSQRCPARIPRRRCAPSVGSGAASEAVTTATATARWRSPRSPWAGPRRAGPGSCPWPAVSKRSRRWG